MPEPTRILILGGSSEANALARLLAARAEFAPVLSLAGRTQNPRLPPIACRIGGFGGVVGLVAYIRGENIGLVVNATHPYAAQMSGHAGLACGEAGAPLLRLAPAPWTPQPGDRWIAAENYPAAVIALGVAPARVFLTHGRLNLAPFAQAPQHHYLVRSIETPDDIALLPNHRLILARGPFALAEENMLLHENRIDFLVTKNSGGAATYPKIEAARQLGLPVVMIARPPGGVAPQVETAAQAVDWIDAHSAAP